MIPSIDEKYHKRPSPAHSHAQLVHCYARIEAQQPVQSCLKRPGRHETAPLVSCMYSVSRFVSCSANDSIWKPASTRALSRRCCWSGSPW